MNPAVMFRTKPLTVYKIGPAELDQSTGKTVRQLLDTVTIRATIQPATGAVSQGYPSGRVAEIQPTGTIEGAAWFVWTMATLETGWWAKYGGEVYHIGVIRPRHETGHTKAFLGKLGDFDGTLIAADTGEYLTLDGTDFVTLGGDPIALGDPTETIG